MLANDSSRSAVTAEPLVDRQPSTSGRPDIAAVIKSQYAGVGAWMSGNQLPVVYHDKYNISFFGIEKLHPFDSCKFRKVLRALQDAKVLTAQQVVTPLEAPRELLLDVHTPEYVTQVHDSNLKIVQVTELAPLLMLPNPLLKWRVISPMKYHVSGTVLAAGLAFEKGWSINLGGGMHHAYSSNGMGWCPFDDLMLAIRKVRTASDGKVKKVLLIDLDAHQGNGVERDKLTFKDNNLFILDIYNSHTFPKDDEAKAGIDIAVELKSYTLDDVYLSKLEGALILAKSRFGQPDLIVYNAGTDILQGDPLGRLSVSRQGVVKRDELVWQYAQEVGAPITMMLSGGYAKDSASVISDSLVNLFNKFNLSAV